MSMVWWIVLVTTVAGVGGTGLGGVVAACFRRDSDKTVSLLLSFAGGVMLSVVCFDLITDALDQNLGGAAGMGIVIAGLLVGFVVIYFLNDMIDQKTNPEVHAAEKDHPQTADELDELIHYDHYEKHRSELPQKGDGRHQLFIAGVVMACAIALHNLPEGMVIGAAYAADADKAAAISGGGLVLAIVIGLHNIPEGMAVSVPLISGGMKRGRAVLLTAASGAPTILGALIGYSLGTLGPVALAASLSFASGAMLYVVFGELIPESILMWRSKMPALAVIVGIITGLVIIYA